MIFKLDTPNKMGHTTWKDKYFKIKNKLKNCWCQKLQFCLGIILPCERCAKLDRARAFIKNCLIEGWDKILFIKYVTLINIIYCECKICIALIEVLWVYWSWKKTDNRTSDRNIFTISFMTLTSFFALHILKDVISIFVLRVVFEWQNDLTLYFLDI